MTVRLSAIESIYGMPVDIGLVVTLNFGENLSITKDLHYIDANLRSQWIEGGQVLRKVNPEELKQVVIAGKSAISSSEVEQVSSLR